ncbi:FBP domain-containing protein [Leifsonia shinshuensis]|uniref:FBP domain-containing protein n=1 Tax=Leifsonia shinshuensis TaxID=150026 RepID=A0A7G6YBE3_9MICO|nr:FBP domain-containing protein [Leifsonia shinshuensis]QNE35808.1 FBP domain-containing protein [Leifsonia shinshuensis]
MLPLNEQQLRSSFVNASQRERKELTLPDLANLRWDDLDYLGWRDRRNPNQGYAIAEVDGEFVGVLLRKADGGVRSRPQCSWCEDVHLPNEVVFFIAKRAGAAGRNGNTLGTLVCAGFECSANVRKRAPLAYVGFDVEAARLQRIEALREHVATFIRRVAEG